MKADEVNCDVFYKIYLTQSNASEAEIRRFVIPGLGFDAFKLKLQQVFPKLSEKSFSIYWKDEEGDEVMVSSLEEFHLAHASMKPDLKKFYLKIENDPTRKRNMVAHPDIFCDGCQNAIVGFRYKCILCSNYDLCAKCECSEIHSDHPMLRIPDPGMFKRSTLEKVVRIMKSFAPRGRPGDRTHCYDSPCMDDEYPPSHKRHKKCEKRQSDEEEDGCHRKHSHSHSHKNVRKGKCPYGQMVNDVFGYLSPRQFQANDENGGGEGVGEEFSHVKHLKSVMMRLQKFLDPLGIDVDLEVRTNGQKKEEQEKESSPPGTPSAPPDPSEQREGRFADPQEVTKKKVDEIASLLAKQTVRDNNAGDNGDNVNNNNNNNNIRSVDNDGWVEFEELQEECEDPRPSGSTGAIPKVREQQQEKAFGGEKKKAEPGKNNATLYPRLSPEQVPTDPAVRSALEKMLSMGFTNEGNWLTYLLEAKRGNICEALEVLEPYAKVQSSSQ